MSDTLTVTEAATVAGVSVRTMRRWATSGQVRTVGSGHGRRIVAASLSKETAKADTNGQEDLPPDVTVSATSVTETASGHEADRLAALVTDLSVRLADQTALTAIWQERARVLGDQLALAAPVTPQEPILAAQTVTPSSVESAVPVWRHWWLLALALAGFVVLVLLLVWPR